MFELINKQGVRSDKGFIVQVTGRFSAEYREGLKKITILNDTGKLPDGRFCHIIESTAFEKWDDGTPIPKDKQEEFLKNYTEAMEFFEIGVKVE